MKKFNVLFTALLCASVMFVGCSDDDDDNGENGEGPGNGDSGVVILPKKVVRIIETLTEDDYLSKDTTLYAYDTEGRLSKITKLDSYEEYVTNFTYTSNKITMKDNYSTDIIELENGRASKVSYDEGEGSWESRYSYSNNYISKIDDGDEDEEDEYIFTVTDGNLMKVVNNYTDEEEVSTITTITYEISDINNNINIDFMPFLTDDLDSPTKLGVAGNRFKKLSAKITIEEKGNDDDIYIYKYQINKDGYITKITETEDDGDTIVYDITYE